MLKLFNLLVFTVICSLFFSIQAHAHPQDEDILLEIEQGQLLLSERKIEQEYIEALKRKKLRKLAAMAWHEKFKLYLVAGFEHIIPKGIDHILFVLGLFFSSLLFTSLLWQVTAFTLAHSVTLVLASFSVITISSNIVEPLIALSIVWVAAENCWFKQTTKWRTIIVFVFGLLHGLGFASVLSDYGLPKNDFIASLLAFNIGIEFGQLTIILTAFLLTLLIRKKVWYRNWMQIPASIIIGGIGLIWFVERIL